MQQTEINLLLANVDADAFVFLEINDYLLINMDVICDRNYRIRGTNELIYEVSRRGQGKKLVYLFRDGANIELSGAAGVISKLNKQLSLTADRCFIVYPGLIEFPGATVIDNQSSRLWEKQINPYIKDLLLSGNNFDKKFAGLYARFDIHRLKLFRYLYENHYNESILAFNGIGIRYFSRFAEYFADDIQWANEHLPHKLDTIETQGLGGMSFRDSLPAIEQHYQRYFIEVVVETDPHSNLFFTEKTMKNFWLGKPFLLYSGCGSLKYLQSLGYQTFRSVINETYDTIENDFDRLEAIKQEINRLSALSIDELKQLHEMLMPIFEHNRNLVKANILKYEPSVTWNT